MGVMEIRQGISIHAPREGSDGGISATFAPVDRYFYPRSP